MIQLAFDGAGFAAACGGVATIIASVGTVIWSVRRDPRGGSNSEITRLPPSEQSMLD
jgi:hypothetical protein